MSMGGPASVPRASELEQSRAWAHAALRDGRASVP